MKITWKNEIILNWSESIPIQMAKFMGPTWGPPGSCRPQMGPMFAPWTWLSGKSCCMNHHLNLSNDFYRQAPYYSQRSAYSDYWLFVARQHHIKLQSKCTRASPVVWFVYQAVNVSQCIYILHFLNCTISISNSLHSISEYHLWLPRQWEV